MHTRLTTRTNSHHGESSKRNQWYRLCKIGNVEIVVNLLLCLNCVIHSHFKMFVTLGLCPLYYEVYIATIHMLRCMSFHARTHSPATGPAVEWPWKVMQRSLWKEQTSHQSVFIVAKSIHALPSSRLHAPMLSKGRAIVSVRWREMQLRNWFRNTDWRCNCDSKFVGVRCSISRKHTLYL